jgi:5-methylcytosine-specific restriction protein A
MQRALKPCSSPGCPEYTTGGRCEGCRRRADKARGTQRERGYGGRWRTIRARKLRRDPQCEGWPVPGSCTRPATEVDHIDGDTANVHASNLRSLCGTCHRRRTAHDQPGGFRLNQEGPRR